MRAELAQEKMAWEEEAARAFSPSKDAQELFMAALVRAYERACEALLRDHAALARTEHDNQRVLNNRCGPLSPDLGSSDLFSPITCFVHGLHCPLWAGLLRQQKKTF